MGSDLNDILEVNDDKQDNKVSLYENKYAGALGAFAIIELISSIILAIYIWVNYGTVNVGMYYTVTEPNPIGIGLGIGVLLQGIIIYVILSALKVMGNDVADIKNLLNKNN